MVIQRQINLVLNGKRKIIFFGQVDSESEKNKMFRFRYKNYLKHNYINENDSLMEADEYDDGRSVYFIATVDGKIIGSIRVIMSEYLPTERECFLFKEPTDMSKISRDKRAELGRLIVEPYAKDIFMPRHLVMLGLLSCCTYFAKSHGIEGGYSFIKNSLRIKLTKIKFPFHVIEDYVQVYKKGVLEKYFADSSNGVCPIYFLTNEVSQYIDKVFNNRLIFRQQNCIYILRNRLLLKLIKFFSCIIVILFL